MPGIAGGDPVAAGRGHDPESAVVRAGRRQLQRPGLGRVGGGFREIQLCDLDDEALTQGVAAQHLAEPHRVRLFGGVDLSGIGARLAAWSPDRPATPAAVAECVAAATAAADPLAEAEPADVAASVCVLSQLIEAVTVALGARHPQLLALVTAVRRRHLELLLERTRPGGAVVLVTDFVSALTCPELATTGEDQLPELTTRLIQQRNFFTGSTVRPAAALSDRGSARFASRRRPADPPLALALPGADLRRGGGHRAEEVHAGSIAVAVRMTLVPAPRRFDDRSQVGILRLPAQLALQLGAGRHQHRRVARPPGPDARRNRMPGYLPGGCDDLLDAEPAAVAEVVRAAAVVQGFEGQDVRPARSTTWM